LETIGGEFNGDRAEAIAFIVNRAAQRHSVINTPTIPVVEHQAIAREISARIAADFNKFADIPPVVVIMKFTDE